jgi:hypothetical protein
MTLWLHSVIFATALTAAGVASAAAYYTITETTAVKSDRLVWSDERLPAEYVTVEERGPGVSVLTRVAVP